MSLDTGFGSHGFVDDRREQEVFSKLTEKLEQPSTTPNFATDDEVDGKMEVDDDLQVYNEDMLKMSKSSVKSKSKEGLSFFQRNKGQIFDALIVLGVIFVAYKLLWDKDGEGEFEEGGDVSYPSEPAITPAPTPVHTAPPRPEMPEPNYNGE
jgi:hypothetical protein|tara:strand:- start:142 stop:597 length:456 start_codon:yes stop_codon:yes gene_type:complete